jgi:aspartate racemase
MKTAEKTPSRLSPLKRRLLHLLLEKKGIQLGALPTVKPRVERGPGPLSFAQERIWIFEQIESGTAAYHVPAAVRLTGALNLEALSQSLTEIVRRHEALRATFHAVEGVPVQVISPLSPLVCPKVDLRRFPRERGEEMAMDLARREVERPFDLSVGPLLRCRLCQLAEDEYIALLTTHHIASDGWSAHLLLGELAALYDAFYNGRTSPLSELPIQYQDFAHWQREQFREEALAEHMAYWVKQLGEEPLSFSLPTDGPRPSVRALREARRFIVLPPSLAASLTELSRKLGATLFMLTLAAFKTLLYRYTWQEEIVVGSPIANRNRAETERLIGFFVNTLVLRTRLGGNPEFRELVDRVREATLGAYAHQDLPFDRLVDALQTKRDAGRQPLFQIFFALNNNPTPALHLDRVTIEPLPFNNGIAKFDLEISLVERAEGLVVNAIYGADLFKDSTVERILRRYERLLRGVVADPAARLLEIPLDENGADQPEAAPTFINSDEFIFE